MDLEIAAAMIEAKIAFFREQFNDEFAQKFNTFLNESEQTKASVVTTCAVLIGTILGEMWETEVDVTDDVQAVGTLILRQAINEFKNKGDNTCH